MTARIKIAPPQKTLFSFTALPPLDLGVNEKNQIETPFFLIIDPLITYV
jgi:hypothetical protein